MFGILLILAQKVDCGYRLEPPQRGGCNMYPQSMFWNKNKKTRYTPVKTPVSLYKNGVTVGIHFMDMFS